MTRKEAIKLVKEVTGMSLDWDDAHYDALQMAIKALEQEPCIEPLERLAESASKTAKVLERIKVSEQEPILDKIRTEIDGIEINGRVDEHTLFIRTGEQVKQMTLDIIDKYRKEQE